MTSISITQFWHPIGTIEEVTETPAAFTLLGERLVAFRDGRGAVVFKDLCIHRGTALSRGWIDNGRLTCPYHGWQYDRTGRCVHIPALPAGKKIPAKARAIVYAVREAYGLVWVSLSEPHQPFPQWTDDAWENPDYRVVLAGSWVWQATAARVIENAMDFAHFNIVHKGYTELADGPEVHPYEVSETDEAFGLRYTYEDGRLRRAYWLSGPFMLHDKKQVIAVGKGGTWSDRTAREGDSTILTFIAAPLDASNTRIYAFVARNHGLDVDDATFTSGFDVIMEQDRYIVESQRPAELPVGLRDEMHLAVPDAAAVAYRRLLRGLGDMDSHLP